ncbi:hypothetical protein ACQ4WX_40470 [Streptomyces lasalocidi]
MTTDDPSSATSRRPELRWLLLSLASPTELPLPAHKLEAASVHELSHSVSRNEFTGAVHPHAPVATHLRAGGIRSRHTQVVTDAHELGIIATPFPLRPTPRTRTHQGVVPEELLVHEHRAAKESPNQEAVHGGQVLGSGCRADDLRAHPYDAEDAAAPEQGDALRPPLLAARA